jgi:hypothetical protein
MSKICQTFVEILASNFKTSGKDDDDDGEED